MTIAWLAVALLSAYFAAAAFFPALALPRRKRLAALVVVFFPIGLSPLWIPSTLPLIRFVAAVNSTSLLVRLYDLHLGACLGLRPDFRTYLLFLPNVFSIVLRKLDAEPRPTARRNMIELSRAFGCAAMALVVFLELFRMDWRHVPFALEHGAKVLVFYLVLIPVSGFIGALWRLAGGRGRDFMEGILLARTPADFWRRYNRPAQQFFTRTFSNGLVDGDRPCLRSW